MEFSILFSYSIKKEIRHKKSKSKYEFFRKREYTRREWSVGMKGRREEDAHSPCLI